VGPNLTTRILIREEVGRGQGQKGGCEDLNAAVGCEEGG
jgi:hypothetical protein